MRLAAPLCVLVLSRRRSAREGGFTRIVRTRYRQHDRAPLAYIEYVDRCVCVHIVF